eukprot:symbB.v1.2.027209.t2/scaffold2775.1/size70737/1
MFPLFSLLGGAGQLARELHPDVPETGSEESFKHLVWAMRELSTERGRRRWGVAGDLTGASLEEISLEAEDFAFDMRDWPFEELDDLLRLSDEAIDVSKKAMADVRTTWGDDGFTIEEREGKEAPSALNFDMIYFNSPPPGLWEWKAFLGLEYIGSIGIKDDGSIEEDLSGSTALMVAARNRKVRIVKAIINWTVPPERLEMLQEAEKFDNKFNILKNLELLRVVGANDRTAVTQLVTVGDGVGTNLADINFQDAQGRQAAHIAITCIGEEEETCAMLRTLYLLKGQINGQDFLGNTPLHLAARIGRSEAAKTLLALKAHPGLKDKKGRTPLMVAAASSLDDVRAPPAMDAWQHGTGLAEEGRFSDAMMAFDKALKLGMQTPEVYEALAQCALMLDNLSATEHAIEAARQAVLLAPGKSLTLAEAQLTLARALRSSLDIPGAIALYEQLDDAEALAELAEAKSQLQKHRLRLKRRCTEAGHDAEELRWERKMQTAKTRRRPSWTTERWKSEKLAEMDLSTAFGICKNNIAHVDVQTFLAKDFGRIYQLTPGLPCVLKNAMEHWSAMKLWTLSSFSADFGHQKVICDHRFGIHLRMNDFIKYLKSQDDDSPLYLFDHCFGEYPSTRALLDQYDVPKIFGEDLLASLGRLRPPYRWLLIGPKRSGSTLHKDPLGTSAWNALISGRKLWVLFPPSTPVEILRSDSLSVSAESAISWFLWWKQDTTSMAGIWFIQEPGEIVFVPARWWHAVLNLEDAIAVTQNFCNEWNAASVWRCAKATHPLLARQLRERLEEHCSKEVVLPGDDPNQSYLFDTSAECSKEEDDSSDDEYLTWLWESKRRAKKSEAAYEPYSGKLVNSGIAWGVTDTVLQWDGLGGPPPELPLRPPGPPEPKPEEQQRRKKFAEMAAEQDQAAKMSVYGSSALDKVKSRADIFASLGFDDQHIFGVDGLVRDEIFGSRVVQFSRGYFDFSLLLGSSWCVKQPANFSNHPGTGDRHHHPGGVLFSRAMDEMILVTLARVAERAERYDEMADFMKQRVQVGSALNPEERDMFSAAFKNSLTERRHAVRVAAGVEQMEMAEGRDAYASLAGGYRSKMEAELQEICSNALNLLATLVASSEPGEAKTFFLKMQGDYYRYLAEWTTGPAKSEVAGQAMEVYKSGMGEAMSLPTAHPVRLGLALNFSVFLHEVLKDTDHAVATATDALNAASAGIEDIPEESRNDSIITMQLLNDNLTLWSAQ